MKNKRSVFLSGRASGSHLIQRRRRLRLRRLIEREGGKEWVVLDNTIGCHEGRDDHRGGGGRGRGTESLNPGHVKEEAIA